MSHSVKSFIKLTSFELERISKVFFGLIGFTLISNLIGYIFPILRFNQDIEEYMISQNISVEMAHDALGPFSFDRVLNSGWIAFPIVIGVTSIGLYALFTWYREWFGKNTFAYRLFMLPVPRMQVFFSKLVTIYIGIYSLIAVQMLSVFGGYQLTNWLIADAVMDPNPLISLIHSNFLFAYLFPVDTGLYFTINLIGLTGILVVFTIILLERSYALKGFGLGLMYAGFVIVLGILPHFIGEFAGNRYLLFYSELMIITYILLALASIGSIIWSRHLINRKITI